MSSPLLTPNKPSHMTLAIAEMDLRNYYAAHIPWLTKPVDPSLPKEALEQALRQEAELRFLFADMMVRVGREGRE